MTPKEQAHFKVLRAIELQPEITQRALARQLGVSMGKANYLINALVEKGLIKIGNFQRSSSKLNKVIYLLTPEGTKNRIQLTRHYLVSKELEYEALKAEITALRKAQSELPPTLAIGPEWDAS